MGLEVDHLAAPHYHRDRPLDLSRVDVPLHHGIDLQQALARHPHLRRGSRGDFLGSKPRRNNRPDCRHRRDRRQETVSDPHEDSHYSHSLIAIVPAGGPAVRGCGGVRAERVRTQARACKIWSTTASAWRSSRGD